MSSSTTATSAFMISTLDLQNLSSILNRVDTVVEEQVLEASIEPDKGFAESSEHMVDEKHIGESYAEVRVIITNWSFIDYLW